MNQATSASSPSTCCACLAEASVEVLLDFGEQPPSNRFLTEGEQEIDRHPLLIGQCSACGLVQLVEPMSVDMVASRFDWLTYNEPESHLDRTVDKLAEVLGQKRDARILGLTYKDESTLRRFTERGFGQCAEIDLAAVAGTDIPRTAIERMQDLVSVDNCRRAASELGRADLLMVRHVLEHAHQPREFFEALRELVVPGGLVVFEVPDSSRFLASGDVCFFWEEHITYFNESTLGRFVATVGGTLEALWVEPYPMENSLIAVVRLGEGNATAASDDGQLAADLAQGRELARLHGESTRRYRAALEKLRAEGRSVYGFGAGHLAAKFINFNQVGDLLGGVIDDSPDKQGLRMPGSALPIVGSAVLDDGSVDLCLMSLSPESEAKVVAAKNAYIEAGGEMRSMFSLSPRSLLTDGESR